VTAVDLILTAVLLAANGFFVSTEFSLARVRPTQVEDWVRMGRPGARSVKHAIERIDSYLAACQLGITLASLGLGVVGEQAFHNLLEPVLGEDARIVGIAVAGALAFALITVLHVVLGELSPKSLAISRTERTVLLVTPPMRVFYLLTKPVVDLFNGLGNLILKPFGIPPAREAGHAPHTEDELRALVRESSREGLIEPEEGTLTENVFTFGDRRAREVMVPRHRIELVTTQDTLDDVVAKVAATGLTRLPLTTPEAGLDEPLGLLHAKDLLVASARGERLSLPDLARPLERIPESMLIDELLERLRKRRDHLALVLDEHGTTVGLITLEDVLEEIVGEIEDEFDPEEVEPIAERDGALVIAGWAPVRLVADRLQMVLEDVHEATIGGYVLEQLGRPPDAGEQVTLDGRTFEVLRAGEASVDELRVVR
jgi:CBS domain containing-hemolysin-like protein